MITHILFDIDDTLMDYYTAEMNVTRGLFAENGVECTQEKLDDSWRMSWYYWDKENLSNTDLPDVQRDYHVRYHRGVLAHCDELARKHGFKMSGEEVYERFNTLFSGQVTLYEDALPVMDALIAKGYVLCAATNGLERIQKERVAALDGRITYLFCSEALGCVKPTKQFFDEVLRVTGAKPEECLMVGDSLTADILGAANAGMTTVWFNHAGKKRKEGVRIDYEISTLSELVKIEELFHA